MSKTSITPERLLATQRQVWLILMYVQKATGVWAGQILSPHKARKVTEARAWASEAMRRTCDLSFPQLGRIFGMNHSTFVLSHNKRKKRLSGDGHVPLPITDEELVTFERVGEARIRYASANEVT